MNKQADRISGVFFLVVGLALVFLIIPSQVEEGSGGHVRPATMPTIIGVMMTALGAILAIRPTRTILPDRSEFIRAGLFTILLLVSVFAMSHFGFVLVVPIMVLALMLLVGERRIGWILGGVVILPTVVWVLVVQVLERTLP